MNRLSITPTKAYGVSKKLGKKMKGVNIGLKQVHTHERLLLPRNSTAKKPQASGPARKRAKKKTHPKRTQKAGTPGNRLHKGIGEFLSQPKLHELGQPIVARDEVDDTVESVSDDAGDGDSRQSLAAKEKLLQSRVYLMMPVMETVGKVLLLKRNLYNKKHSPIWTMPVILLVTSLPSRMTVTITLRERRNGLLSKRIWKEWVLSLLTQKTT